MPVYSDSEALYAALTRLFTAIQSLDHASETVSAARLIIRLRLKDPEAEVVINGRTQPPKITYGRSMLLPDLDVQMSADTLHQILLKEMPVKRAMLTGQLRVNGALKKAPVFESVLHAGQAVYPRQVSGPE